MKLSAKLKSVTEWTGKIIAWLTVPMVLGTFIIVVLRYAFDLGWIWMQESVVWLHAAVFMLAAAYTLKHDDHVRVDIFYRELSANAKAWINIVGTWLLLFPVAGFLIVTSWDYVSVSWSIREGSREAGGLPYPFVPVLKSLIPLTAVLLIVQGVANCIDDFATLSKSRASADDEDH